MLFLLVDWTLLLRVHIILTACFALDKSQILDLQVLKRANLVFVKEQGDMAIDNEAFIDELSHDYERYFDLDLVRQTACTVASVLDFLALRDTLNLRANLIAKSRGIPRQHTIPRTCIQVSHDSQLDHVLQSHLHVTQRQQILTTGWRTSNQAREIILATLIILLRIYIGLTLFQISQQHEGWGLAIAKFEKGESLLEFVSFAGENDGAVKSALLGVDGPKEKGQCLFVLLVDYNAVLGHLILRMVNINLI